MIDDFAKSYLLGDLRSVRQVMLSKLDGLSEYDIRRPLTATGTNLLGLIKHLTIYEAWYFGEAFGRPFPWPRWDAAGGDHLDTMWVTADDSRDHVVDRYRQAWVHADATIEALDIDAPGHVPWWPRPDVKLFNVMVHMLTETSRHAWHADILREQLDGAIGNSAESSVHDERFAALWEVHRAKIEQAATAAATRLDAGPPQQDDPPATLLLLNGPPASGKSTLAARYVHDHPLALNLDIDVIRGLLGRWIEQPLDAGHAARPLALAMAEAHLRNGHDVIVPQFLARADFIEQLETLAAALGCRFVEVALMTTRHDAIHRFQERSASPENQQHIDAAAHVAKPPDVDPVGDMYDAFRRLVETRPRTLLMPVTRGDIDATYLAFAAAITPIDRR